jgi:hypothetical protein
MSAPAFRRVALALSGLAAMLLLTGCRADLTTTLDASAPGPAKVRLVASGAFADALLREPALDQEILSTVAEFSGQPASRDESDGTITYETTIDGANPPAGLLGYRGLTGNTSGAEISVELDEPTRLLDAVARATADEPDAAAQRIAWGNALVLTLKVCGDGDAVSTTGDGVLADGCAQLEAPINSWVSEGTWTTRFEKQFPSITVALGAGLVALALIAVAVRRRSPRR